MSERIKLENIKGYSFGQLQALMTTTAADLRCAANKKADVDHRVNEVMKERSRWREELETVQFNMAIVAEFYLKAYVEELEDKACAHPDAQS